MITGKITVNKPKSTGVSLRDSGLDTPYKVVKSKEYLEIGVSEIIIPIGVNSDKSVCYFSLTRGQTGEINESDAGDVQLSLVDIEVVVHE